MGVAGIMKLKYIAIPSTEVVLSEDGSYTYIPTGLYRTDCTPFVFHSKTRAGWTFSFFSSAQNSEWRIIVKSSSGGLSNGTFDGLLFCVTK